MTRDADGRQSHVAGWALVSRARTAMLIEPTCSMASLGPKAACATTAALNLSSSRDITRPSGGSVATTYLRSRGISSSRPLHFLLMLFPGASSSTPRDVTSTGFALSKLDAQVFVRLAQNVRDI